MKQSHLFTKTRKDAPKDETSKNAQLLIRAGYVYKVMAGVYAYTPLGLRVLEKIKTIVREEMHNVMSQELIMTSLQPKDTWDQTGRWSDEVVDVWFKSKLKDGSDIGLAWSHEEAIIEMMKQHIESYKDLPVSVYQFQTKLRNELRAKSGIMRGREFLMKDMYSMCLSIEQHEEYYNSVIEAYKEVYRRIGIGDDTYVTYASGGAFTKFSHEFQTVCEAGEDVIYLHRGKNIAINEEIANDESLKNLGIRREELEKVKSAEVGNIFTFGTEKSEQTDFAFTDKDGKKQFIHLGSYGIGITRLMGVAVEKFSDSKGIVWPESIAPFQVHLLSLGQDDEAEKLYRECIEAGIEVLYDNRDITAGAKFIDSDLLGIPYRVVVGKKSLEQGGVEIKKRTEEHGSIVMLQDVAKTLKH